MRKAFNAKRQSREGAKILITFGLGFGKHDLVNAISGPALVNLGLTALRPSGFAPLR
jgi:hypothetical protein